jgi:hypothetical protein
MESKVRKGKVITKAVACEGGRVRRRSRAKAVACEGGSVEVFNEKGKRIATLDVPES